MAKVIALTKLYPESFRANIYSLEPFRMIGLVDVSIQYSYGTEKVTLAFYRSSGTNSGKIKGLWYPIVGIKTHSGRFTEFTEYLNFVLTNTTRSHRANRGWLAKSLFFARRSSSDPSKIRGFSTGKHYEVLYETGKTLRDLYENKHFYYMKSLDAETLNHTLAAGKIYQDNKYTQRENFEWFIEDIFHEYK
jgi:hypothetical protein